MPEEIKDQKSSEQVPAPGKLFPLSRTVNWRTVQELQVSGTVKVIFRNGESENVPGAARITKDTESDLTIWTADPGTVEKILTAQNKAVGTKDTTVQPVVPASSMVGTKASGKEAIPATDPNQKTVSTK